ncbi:type II toxin-antitoxin system RelE/ParE family toxin [Methylobacter tundripaludum]|uniref:type II toxin-antitoxin system RelE/ParE family toxin n=1 Tax=Methylobacter tundripaludum TaxID=173365 RepID=UPI001C68551D|nr:type II toxin-antitoxin system RelE/ParE family toxin [Methylobacter tundripaludum]
MIQRTAQAEEDLIEIWIYIAQDNPRAADRVLDDIEQRFHALADNPLMGRLRSDIAPELRYFVVGSYLILYRTAEDGIQIVRVIHGARDLPHLF